MKVREHLQLQLVLARQVRWLVMVALAAALVWLYPDHSPGTLRRLWMFAAVLLYLWLLGALVGALLNVPMARPRCPRCANRLTLGATTTSCPSCNVSLDARVRRDWPYPWLPHSWSLRTGDLEHL